MKRIYRQSTTSRYSARQRAARQRICGRRGGSGLVEFALVAPLLLGMLLGIIDFGILARNSLVIANASREGARAAALGQPTANIYARVANGGAPTLKTNAAGQITNGSVLMQQAVYGGVPVYVAWPADSGIGTSAQNGAGTGNFVRITVIYEHRSISGLFNRTISIPVVMRREG